MKNSLSRVRGLLPALSLLSLSMHSAFAQNSDPNALVISASRFESLPQDKPIATQIISSEEIRYSAATTVAEVLGKIGGIHTRINFTGIPDSALDLRGFGMTGDQNTLVLVNGQRLSENEGIAARLSSIPLDSIERIEILRGMGGVLYGSGATSGTINIITRAPTQEGVTGATSVAIGSYNLQDIRARMQAKSKDWGVSLNAQKYRTDNYRNGNRAESDTLAGEIRYGGQKDFAALRFGADEQKSRLPGVRKINLKTGVNQFLTDPRGVTTPDDYLDSKTNHISAHAEKHLNDVILALDISKKNKNRDSFGSYEDKSGSSLASAHTDTLSVSPRLMVSSPLFGVKNSLTIGGDWSSWDYANNTVGVGTAGNLVEDGRQRNQAAYLRNEIYFQNNIRLSLGAREEGVKIDNNYFGSDAWGGSLKSSRTTEYRLTAHELMLQKDWHAGYSTYFRTGKSFRVANIDENRCDLYAAPCNSMLKPQTSQDQEIGIQWQNQISNLRVSLYKMNVTDEIHYNPFTLSNMNLAPTQHTGIELDGSYAVSQSLSFGGKYSHTKARFSEGSYQGWETNDYSYSPFSASLVGRSIPLIPNDRLSVNLNWKFSAATRLVVFANYVGKQYYDNDQLNHFSKMPSYVTTDIKVSHVLSGWKLSAGVNNIFDKAYYSYGVTNVTATVPLRYNVYPEARRNGYMSAEYRF